MKHKLVFRIFAIALTLSLMMLALPLSPALALAETITVAPDEGTIGDDLDISGTGTLGQEYYIYFSSQGGDDVDVGDDIDTDVTAYEFLASVTAGGFEGTFSTMNLKVPDELTDGDDLEVVHGGTYYIYMTRNTSTQIRTMDTFTVTGVTVITNFEPDEGTVGTEVEISGVGFAPDEVIIVQYDGDEIDIDSGDTEADEDGKFTLFIIIPESTFGENTITIIGEDSLAELELVFTVVPEIVIDPEEGEAGTNVTIIGTGFDRYGDVVITFNGDEVKEKRAGSNGSFDTFFTVPDVAEGAYDILAEDEDNNDIFAEAEFTVIVNINTAITVTPTSGNVGDEVTVTGVDFGASATVTLYFDNVSVGTVAAGPDGSLSGSLTIPASTTGSHTIKAEDGIGRSATTTITVEPEMTMTPTTGAMLDEIAVSGSGFGAEKTITILYGTAAVTPTAPITTNPDGSFSGSFLVPPLPAGSYTVTVTDSTSSLTTSFVVVAGITISPTSGIVGSGVGVAGYGFGANKSITILYGTVAVTPTAPITTNPDGSFSGGFFVPANPAGSYTVTVTDGTSSLTTSFVVVAEATISPTSGNIGDTVTVSGTGFGANSPITITYNNAAVTPTAPIITSADGSFSGTFTIPPSVGGAHTITVSDGVTAEQFTFVMESTPPASPQPLLPLGGDKPKQPVQFDWADVTDPSGVTYTLQISRDENFTTLVLEKTGLTESKYTMTEAEKLESVSKDEPYYWRVKAIDGASNESGWTGVGSFYIGGFAWDWVKYLLIGLGVVVVVIIGFWLGMRTAYSSF